MSAKFATLENGKVTEVNLAGADELTSNKATSNKAGVLQPADLFRINMAGLVGGDSVLIDGKARKVISKTLRILSAVESDLVVLLERP
jgi:hypothetical protein